MVSPQGSEHLANIRQKLIHNAYLRPDVWRSKDEARSHFSETKRCRKWDTRVMDLYVVSHRTSAVRPVIEDNEEHGLRPHPAFKWSRAPFHGVTLACTREQEAVSPV